MIRATKRRRSAEETRRAILDCAEKRLVRDGPSALRLKDIASDVGVSHPAVLHHFGSREGLVHAVTEQAIAGLQADLVRALAKNDGSPPSGESLFERVFETLLTRGQARLIAWLALEGHDPFAAPGMHDSFAKVTKLTHALRTAGKRALAQPSYEDTAFTVALSAMALFGQALIGRATFAASGLGRDAAVERRFRAWLARLLAGHLGR